MKQTDMLKAARAIRSWHTGAATLSEIANALQIQTSDINAFFYAAGIANADSTAKEGVELQDILVSFNLWMMYRHTRRFMHTPVTIASTLQPD